jgi:hypothetical protein
MAGVVDSGMVVAAGSTQEFRAKLTKNGAVYNLTAKVVQATIRREDDFGTVLDASLEDIAVALGNPDTLLVDGGVTFTKDLNPNYFATPANPLHHYNYLVQFHVTTDDFYPDMLRFGVRRVAD